MRERLIATRFLELMASPDARICQLGEGGLSRVTCEVTGHGRIRRDIPADPERMLRIRLEA